MFKEGEQNLSRERLVRYSLNAVLAIVLTTTGTSTVEPTRVVRPSGGQNSIPALSGGQSCSFDPDCPTVAPYCNIDYSKYPQIPPSSGSSGKCSSIPQEKPLSCGMSLNWGDECKVLPGTSCVNIYQNERGEGVCLPKTQNATGKTP